MQDSIDPVTLFLISIAAIFLIGALGEVSFQRTNIPDVIWLILAGILLGPLLGFVTPEMLKQIAPYFAALTLVVVLFEGGSALKLDELSQAAPRSGMLALLAFIFSVGALAVTSMGAASIGLLPDSWSWTHGLLLGAILGGSSSIIIMPAMAQARLPAKLANLVNLESALTDAFCVVGTSAIIDVMATGGAGANPGMALGKSFGIGLAIGAAAGLIWILFLRFLHSNEHAYPLTLSALLILYVVIDNAGGSAALGILTVAIMLGNAPKLANVIGLKFTQGLDTEVRGFHRQMAFIVKSFFFVFIGAMLGPPWGLIGLGVLLGGALLVARLPVVRISTLGSDFTPGQRKMIGVCMPRGMAAGVLATLPAAANIEGTEQLPVVVFACVFTTILIFAVGFPLVKKQLPIDEAAPAVVLPAGAARPSIPIAAPSPEQTLPMVPVAPTARAVDSVALEPTLQAPVENPVEVSPTTQRMGPDDDSGGG
jgi:cell volume regulation protein A